MTFVVGIDPGLDGAIATLSRDGKWISIHDMPTLTIQRGGKNKRELDLSALAELLRRAGNMGSHAVVEQVSAMPGQGVTSMFSFGRSYGAVLGILAAQATPVTMVPPVRWKKALVVPAGKDGARARASQLLPLHAHNWPLVKHDGRAEAALIAEYGRRVLHREAA